MPKVSVIIPNYNHYNFLQKRIDSVLHQTFQDFELIILDDCSTDGSREIIQKYSNHKKVSNIVYNTSNSGSTFKQWERGFQLAKGELIWIAESDDYCDPDFLEKLIVPFNDISTLVLCYCASNIVDENEFIKDSIIRNELHFDVKDFYYNGGTNEIKSFLLFRPVIPNASAVIFKKAALAMVRNSFQEFKICGDWLFWIEIVKQGTVAYYGKPKNYFRRITNVSEKPLFTKDESPRIFHLEIVKLINHSLAYGFVQLSFYEKLKLIDHRLSSIFFSIFRKQLRLKFRDFYFILNWAFKNSVCTILIIVKIFIQMFFQFSRKIMKKIFSLNSNKI